MDDRAFKTHAVEISTHNQVESYVGPPGTGKTVALLAAGHALSKRSYVIGHDPNMSFTNRKTLETLAKLGIHPKITRHDSLSSIRRQWTIDPSGIHVTHVDLTSIMTMAIDVAKQERRKIGGREYGIPVTILVDEIVVWKEAKRNRIGPVLEDYLSRRRHYNVGLLFGAQYARMMHYSLIMMSNKLHLFRMTDRSDLQRLAAAGVPDSYIEALPTVPEFQHLVYGK